MLLKSLGIQTLISNYGEWPDNFWVFFTVRISTCNWILEKQSMYPMKKMCVFYFVFAVDLSHSVILFGYSVNSLHCVRVTHIHVIQENAFENVVCEMTTILSLPQFFNSGFGSSKVGQFKASTPPQVTKHISRVYASWKQSWPHSPVTCTPYFESWGNFYTLFFAVCI